MLASGASAGASICSCRPSPSPSMAATVPSSSTMPVNTPGTVCARLGQRLQQALDEHVRADLARARLEQRRRLGERADAERAEQRPPVAADQARREEQRERVDEARAQQRGRELGAALDAAAR